MKEQALRRKLKIRKVSGIWYVVGLEWDYGYETWPAAMRFAYAWQYPSEVPCS